MWNGTINWFTPSEVGEQKYIVESERKINELAIKKSSAKLLPKNRTVLYSSRATIGNTAIITSDSTTNQGFQSFVCIDAEDANYIYYYADKITHNAKKLAFGSTFLEIPKRELESINIFVPDKAERNQISALLSKIDKLITLEQEKQNKYFSIYLSLRENSFPKNNESKPNLSKKPWRKTKMESIFSESTVRSSEGELLSVTISDGIKKASEVNKTDNSSVDKRNYKKVEKGDIVYNSMRLWQGAVGVSPYNGIVSPAYTVLKTDDFINQTFISQYFKTFFMLHKFKSYSQGLTSDQWNLKFPQLSTMGIYVPEKYIQNEIANILQTSYKLYITQKNKIKELNKVKKKLLSEMFV